MSVRRALFAVAAGLLLATFPFLRYVHFGDLGVAHSNHEPRHGGQLGMVGDHHIEVRRRDGRIEAYVSDAWRRPVVPVSAQVVFDRSQVADLTWQGHCLVGADKSGAELIEVVVVLAGGTRLATTFDFSEP